MLNRTSIGSNLILWGGVLLNTDYREYMKNNDSFLNYFNDNLFLFNLMSIRKTVHWGILCLILLIKLDEKRYIVSLKKHVRKMLVLK